MKSKLRYVPPIKTSFLILVFISYFPLLLGLFLLFNQFGIIIVLLFTVFYALLMVAIFLLLSQSYYLEIHEDDGKLYIHMGLKKHEVEINQISSIELKETKRSFILSVSTKDKIKKFSLSGSLSFEEPPFVPFLREMQELKSVINLGEYCQQVLHGDSSFNPWSSKMYFAYWTYITVMVAYYLLLLLALYILK